MSINKRKTIALNNTRYSGETDNKMQRKTNKIKIDIVASFTPIAGRGNTMILAQFLFKVQACFF